MSGKPRDSGIGIDSPDVAKSKVGTRQELKEKKKAAIKARKAEEAARRRLIAAQEVLADAEKEGEFEEEQLAKREKNTAILAFERAKKQAAAAIEEEERLEATFGDQESIPEEEDEEMATGTGNTGTVPKRPTTEEQEHQARVDAVSAAAAAAAGAAGGGDGGRPPGPVAGGQGGGDRENDVRQREAAVLRSVNANQLTVLGEFWGEGTEYNDIESFCCNVARCMDAFGWTDSVTSQLVQTRLRGAAAVWLRSMIKTATDDMKLRYWSNQHFDARGRQLKMSGLRQLLLARFREEINGRGAIEAIADLRQRATETVDEFMYRVLLSMDRKNYRADEDKKNTEDYRQQLKDDTYTWFAAGLHEDIRMAALGGVDPPESLSDLLTTARNAERERKRARKPKFIAEMEEKNGGAQAAAVSASGNQERGTTAELQLAELQAEIAAIKKQQQQQQSYAPSEVVCWICDRRGHISRFCTQRDRGNSDRRRGDGGGDYRGGYRGGYGGYGGYGGGQRGGGGGQGRNRGRRVFLRPVKGGDKSKRLFEMVEASADDDDIPSSWMPMDDQADDDRDDSY